MPHHRAPLVDGHEASGSRAARDRRLRFELRGASATAAEAAAVVAALERFVRETAPPTAPPAGGRGRPWQRMALIEGVDRTETGPTPWGDGMPWG